MITLSLTGPVKTLAKTRMVKSKLNGLEDSKINTENGSVDASLISSQRTRMMKAITPPELLKFVCRRMTMMLEPFKLSQQDKMRLSISLKL